MEGWAKPSTIMQYPTANTAQSRHWPEEYMPFFPITEMKINTFAMYFITTHGHSSHHNK